MAWILCNGIFLCLAFMIGIGYALSHYENGNVYENQNEINKKKEKKNLTQIYSLDAFNYRMKMIYIKRVLKSEREWGNQCTMYILVWIYELLVLRNTQHGIWWNLFNNFGLVIGLIVSFNAKNGSACMAALLRILANWSIMKLCVQNLQIHLNFKTFTNFVFFFCLFYSRPR